jgi:hypothetical protein
MHKLFRKMALKEFGVIFLETPEHMVFVFEAEWNASNFIQQLNEKFIFNYDIAHTTVMLYMWDFKDR